MTRISLFILSTLGLIYFSRKSLNNPKSHGFYRFFAFESIAALILLNHPYWFREPFAPLHILSWLLLLISIFFILQSLLLLKQHGGHAERKDMPENLPFENTVHIVETGLYRFIRHPMYSSLFFLAWGAFFKHITLLTLGVIILANGFLIAAAKVEERENLRFFGGIYAKYMARTKMFIPWLL